MHFEVLMQDHTTKLWVETLLELMLKNQNLKKKRKGKKEKEIEFSPAEDRTWFASVIDLHDNHYTTHTADSVMK